MRSTAQLLSKKCDCLLFFIPKAVTDYTLNCNILHAHVDIYVRLLLV